MPKLVGNCQMVPWCIRNSKRKGANIFGITGEIGDRLEERNLGFKSLLYLLIFIGSGEVMTEINLSYIQQSILGFLVNQGEFLPPHRNTMIPFPQKLLAKSHARKNSFKQSNWTSTESPLPQILESHKWRLETTTREK